MMKEYLLRDLMEVKIALILSMVKDIVGNTHPTILQKLKNQ